MQMLILLFKVLFLCILFFLKPVLIVAECSSVWSSGGDVGPGTSLDSDLGFSLALKAQESHFPSLIRSFII